MNDAMISLILQGLQYLDCKTSNQTKGDALEVIVFDEIVKVDT